MDTQTETKLEKQINDLIKLFEDWLPEIDIDYILSPYPYLDNINDSNDLYEIIENNDGFNIDIIYYSRAMKYLSENDTSLSESVEIASDMGFDLENINSDTLASLHASQKVREDFYSITDKINEILSE